MTAVCEAMMLGWVVLSCKLGQCYCVNSFTTRDRIHVWQLIFIAIISQVRSG